MVQSHVTCHHRTSICRHLWSRGFPVTVTPSGSVFRAEGWACQHRGRAGYRVALEGITLLGHGQRQRRWPSPRSSSSHRFDSNASCAPYSCVALCPLCLPSTEQAQRALSKKPRPQAFSSLGPCQSHPFPVRYRKPFLGPAGAHSVTQRKGETRRY